MATIKFIKEKVSVEKSSAFLLLGLSPDPTADDKTGLKVSAELKGSAEQLADMLAEAAKKTPALKTAVRRAMWRMLPPRKPKAAKKPKAKAGKK